MDKFFNRVFSDDSLQLKMFVKTAVGRYTLEVYNLGLFLAKSNVVWIKRKIVINCSFFVNVCFFMQNFCLTILTFRVTFTPLSFWISRDLKFSPNHNFKQLNSIGGNLILKVK